MRLCVRVCLSVSVEPTQNTHSYLQRPETLPPVGSALQLPYTFHAAVYHLTAPLLENIALQVESATGAGVGEGCQQIKELRERETQASRQTE